MYRFRLAAAASALAIAHMSTAALAADNEGEAAVAAEGAAADASAGDSAADGYADQGLTTIVVTATKRETDLQQTPIAISVVDSQQLQDRHIQSLINLADGAVPSLRVATFEARQSALTIGIRGIVPFDQNQVAREPGVGVYIDGVYLGRSQGLNAALFDVQRIEVLRGPQGTLFGRNTEGGALSIVTKAPTGEFGGRVSAGIGNYGAYNGEIHLDLPALANFAVKVDGVLQHQGATTDNPASGQYGWNYYNRVGGRIAGRWTPVDGLTVDLSYDRAKDENTPFYSQLLNYNPLGLAVGTYTNPATGLVGTTLFSGGQSCNSTTNRCIAPLAPLVQVEGDDRMKVADLGVIQQPSVDKTHGYTAAIKYALTPDLEVRSISAWRGVETHQWDGSAGAHRNAFVPNGQFGRYSLSELFQHQFSQELQLVGSLPSLDFVLGGYYFNEHVREAAATPNPLQWNAAGTGYTFVNQVPANPTAPISSSNQGWDRAYWYVQRDSQAVGKSYGAFGQATWTPPGLDIVHLTAGGRYTHETRKGALTTINNAPLPGATLDYSNNRFDPMVTLAVDAAPGINLYAKYATGFRAGGANSRSSSFRQFAPEIGQGIRDRRQDRFPRPPGAPQSGGVHHGPHQHPDRLRFRRYPRGTSRRSRQPLLQQAHGGDGQRRRKIADQGARTRGDRAADRRADPWRILCLHRRHRPAGRQSDRGIAGDVRRDHPGVHGVHPEERAGRHARLRKAREHQRHPPAASPRRQLCGSPVQLPVGRRADRFQLHRECKHRAGGYPAGR